MENKDSQNFGGEIAPENREGVFSAEESRPEFISGATKDMERDMGVAALEGLEELTEVQPEIKSELPGGDLVAEEQQVEEIVEKSEDKLVEEAEKLTAEKKGRPGELYDEMKEKRRQMLALMGHYAIGGDK